MHQNMKEKQECTHKSASSGASGGVMVSKLE